MQNRRKRVKEEVFLGLLETRLVVSVGQTSKWTRIHRTFASKSKGGVMERSKLVDGVGRAVKYCLRILHPPTRLVCLPRRSANPLLNTFVSPKILPSRRNQKLNVAAFISRWRSQPLIPGFSSSLLFMMHPFATPNSPPSPIRRMFRAKVLVPLLTYFVHWRFLLYEFAALEMLRVSNF